MKTLIRKSRLSGILIGFASCVNMCVDNKYLGAFLFSFGLIAVILLKANLFTGKVGYINSKQEFFESLLILIVNLITAYLVGFIYKLCVSDAKEFANRFVDYKIEFVLFKSIITGILIYLACELYKKSNNILVIIICVMGFILSGSYHCIADCTYFGASTFSFKGLLYLLIVIVGNSIGSLLIRFLQNELEKKRDIE